MLKIPHSTVSRGMQGLMIGGRMQQYNGNSFANKVQSRLPQKMYEEFVLCVHEVKNQPVQFVLQTALRFFQDHEDLMREFEENLILRLKIDEKLLDAAEQFAALVREQLRDDKENESSEYFASWDPNFDQLLEPCQQSSKRIVQLHDDFAQTQNNYQNNYLENYEDGNMDVDIDVDADNESEMDLYETFTSVLYGYKYGFAKYDQVVDELRCLFDQFEKLKEGFQQYCNFEYKGDGDLILILAVAVCQ